MQVLKDLVYNNLKDNIQFIEKDGLIIVVQNDKQVYKNTYNNVKIEIEKYISSKKEDAYLNAVDCLKFGYAKNSWNSCNLQDNLKTEIWNRAKKDMEIL